MSIGLMVCALNLPPKAHVVRVASASFLKGFPSKDVDLQPQNHWWKVLTLLGTQSQTPAFKLPGPSRISQPGGLCGSEGDAWDVVSDNHSHLESEDKKWCSPPRNPPHLEGSEEQSAASSLWSLAPKHNSNHQYNEMAASLENQKAASRKSKDLYCSRITDVFWKGIKLEIHRGEKPTSLHGSCVSRTLCNHVQGRECTDPLWLSFFKIFNGRIKAALFQLSRSFL